MKIFLLVLFVVLTSCSAYGEESRAECPEDNLWYGSGLWSDRIQDVASWEDCGRICALTPICNFWSWNVDDNTNDGHGCLLYETNAGSEDKDNFMSGERGCPEEECKEEA